MATQKKTKDRLFNTDNHLMQVKVLQNREHSAILKTCIKLPPVFKSFILSIFEWPLKTGLTVSNLVLLPIVIQASIANIKYLLVRVKLAVGCRNSYLLGHVQVSVAVNSKTQLQLQEFLTAGLRKFCGSY